MSICVKCKYNNEYIDTVDYVCFNCRDGAPIVTKDRWVLFYANASGKIFEEDMDLEDGKYIITTEEMEEFWSVDIYKNDKLWHRFGPEYNTTLLAGDKLIIDVMNKQIKYEPVVKSQSQVQGLYGWFPFSYPGVNVGGNP